MPARSLSSYQLVFDAVYTPLQTQLLRHAQVRTDHHVWSSCTPCLIWQKSKAGVVSADTVALGRVPA